MKKLTLKNRNELLPYIAAADYNEYNSNIVTMLMWSSMYEVYFEVFDHFALAFTKMPHRSDIWMMPYCEKAYRNEAMEKIAELSATLHMDYEIHSMTLEFKNWLQKNYPDKFLIWDCYDARDYIYDRMQQQSLSGKKMQKRRNHFHAFEKEYEGRYIFKPMEQADIANVYAFLKKWQAGKDQDESIDAEEAGIHLLLEHMDELPIQGGCIYIDGKLEAFNITSRLSHDTVQIHVEKANRNIRGLYIAIVKLFLETLDDEILYLNREDDMGLEDLRKAKSDMQPILKKQKLGCVYQNIEVHTADEHWLPQIQALWMDRFEEENETSTNYFFHHLYHPEECYLLTSEDELIAMIQARHMNIMLNGVQEDVSFIVGVATNADYEGCGYMKRLMHHVLADRKEKGERFTLLQAYDWDIYKPMGFKETYKLMRTKLDKNSFTMSNGVNTDQFTADELLAIYQTYTDDKNGYRLRDVRYYNTMNAYKAIWNDRILVHRDTNGAADAYMVLHEDVQEIHVQECIFVNEQARDAMLSLLATTDKKIYVYTDLDCELAGRRKPVTTMAVKELGDAHFPDGHLFINEEI